MEVKNIEFELDDVIENEERLMKELYDRQDASEVVYHRNLVSLLNELKLRRNTDFRVNQFTLVRRHHVIDDGTKLFHDYADQYEGSLIIFMDRVTAAANKLIENGGRILNIDYPSDNLAVIVYLEPVMKDD